MKIIQGIASFLTTLAIYLGLPLLGWGLDDLGAFFSTPQRIGYALSIAVFGGVAYQVVQRPGELGTRGKGQVDKFVPRQRIIRFLVTGMLFGALILVPFADRRSILAMLDSQALRWAGLSVATFVMALIFWSGIALGRYYSPEVTLQQDHQLVTDGPYHVVRHPRYLGGMFQGIGLSLLFRSWIGIVLTMVFIALVSSRIQDEEALMRKEFGDNWGEYCKRSWRLIPFIF